MRVPLLFVLLALVAVPSSAAGNSVAFDDPAGDVSGIPDITHVAASSSDSGLLTFRTTFAAPPVFGNGVGFSLLVDADAYAATGHSDGVDYWFIFRTATGKFEPGVWDGTEFAPYASKARASIVGSAVTITVPASEIGAMRAIRFFVASYDATQVDDAPDQQGRSEVFVTFRLKIRRPLHVRFVPSVPRAGSTFRAVGAGIRCHASLAGRSFGASCRWRLPRSSKGKRLVVAVADDGGRSKRYVFKVR